MSLVTYNNSGPLVTRPHNVASANVNVNVTAFAKDPNPVSSSEVLLSATRRPLIETEASSVLV